MSAPLKLIALDAADLEVVSAALQDAVGKLGDLVYDAGGRTLTFAVNRFVWEAGRSARVRSALQVGSVLSVRSRRVRRAAPDAVVSVLSVRFEPDEAPGGEVVVTLAGDGEIRMAVECVDAVLADLSEPWPTPRRPAHDLAGDD